MHLTHIEERVLRALNQIDPEGKHAIAEFHHAWLDLRFTADLTSTLRRLRDRKLVEQDGRGAKSRWWLTERGRHYASLRDVNAEDARPVVVREPIAWQDKPPVDALVTDVAGYAGDAR